MSVETLILKDKISILIRHIPIPLMLLMLVRKFMFHHQRAVYHISPPWGLHVTSLHLRHLSRMTKCTQPMAERCRGWRQAQELTAGSLSH